MEVSSLIYLIYDPIKAESNSITSQSLKLRHALGPDQSFRWGIEVNQHPKRAAGPAIEEMHKAAYSAITSRPWVMPPAVWV